MKPMYMYNIFQCDFASLNNLKNKTQNFFRSIFLKQFFSRLARVIHSHLQNSGHFFLQHLSFLFRKLIKGIKGRFQKTFLNFRPCAKYGHTYAKLGVKVNVLSFMWLSYKLNCKSSIEDNLERFRYLDYFLRPPTSFGRWSKFHNFLSSAVIVFNLFHISIQYYPKLGNVSKFSPTTGNGSIILFLD